MSNLYYEWLELKHYFPMVNNIKRCYKKKSAIPTDKKELKGFCHEIPMGGDVQGAHTVGNRMVKSSKLVQAIHGWNSSEMLLVLDMCMNSKRTIYRLGTVPWFAPGGYRSWKTNLSTLRHIKVVKGSAGRMAS